MKRTRTQNGLLVLAAFFFAIPLFAQEPAAPKQTPPAGGPPKAFTLPALRPGEDRMNQNLK